jgi:hypothetical protein
MSRICKECGHTIDHPRMDEKEYRDLLREIGGDRGNKNRIVAWIESVELESGLEEAIFTLEDYIANGCGISG